MQAVLGVLVPSLNRAFTHGFAVYDGHLKRAVFIRLAIIRLFADGPGLFHLIHRFPHNAYLGCLYCRIRGTWLAGAMRFLFSEEQSAPKSHAWVKLQVR
jgi:hypothetical protein